MKLMIIRHGDPDYERDTLTEKGWREAHYLADYLSNFSVRDFYVSPLGRARDTASLTLKKMNRTAVTCEWLREFAPKIHRPDRENAPICWDWLPQDWTVKQDFYDIEKWAEQKAMQDGRVREEYDWVTANLDEILAAHGYVRDGRMYQAVQPNTDTLVFFCHFGLGCVLISHLLGISPMALWHGLCAAPTSITTLVTEERREGAASFRMLSYGDTTHLALNQEEPSPSARFCECFSHADERHD